MITLVFTVAAYVDDPKKLAALSPALDEVLKAFTSLVAGVSEESRTSLVTSWRILSEMLSFDQEPPPWVSSCRL